MKEAETSNINVHRIVNKSSADNLGSGGAMPGRIPLLVGLFFISSAMLGLEIILTRVLSFTLYHHFIYLVVSMAMLGLASGGAVLASFPSLRRMNPATLLVGGALGFALFVHPSMALMGWLQVGLDSCLAFHLFAIYFLMFVPFFFVGAVIAYIFSQRTERVGFWYFIDLLGAGVACGVFLLLLNWLDVTKILNLIALFGALSAFCFSIGVSRRGAVASAVFISVLAFFQPGEDPLYGFKCFKIKPLNEYRERHDNFQLEYSKWDPLARVDVFSAPGESLFIPGNPYKIISHDGAAVSFLIPFPPQHGHPDFYNYFFTSLAYLYRPHPDSVCVIGLGGANDINTARYFGASEIVGVEINKATIDVIRHDFADFVGRPYQDPRVKIVHADGRSFVRRSDRRFDIIQMTGVDTHAGLLSGSYVLS